MSGLRIAYSNSYDVLKAQLLDAVTERIQDAETESIFNALELVTPSKDMKNNGSDKSRPILSDSAVKESLLTACHIPKNRSDSL